MTYKEGTKFTVCSPDEILKKGWTIFHWQGYQKCYEHINFPKNRIIYSELEKYQSQTLTVKAQVYTDWYRVEEENWNVWPVATFLLPLLKDEEITGWRGICEGDTCIEGMTPIDGWFICKTCGTNLTEIIK